MSDATPIPASTSGSSPTHPGGDSRLRMVLPLAGAIVCEVTATLSLKGALDVPALYALVVVGYLAAFVLLAMTLRAGMALGVAYGLWGATGVVLTAVLSWMVFAEPITLLMALGIAVVVAGVLCVELGSATASSGEAR